MGIPPKLKEYIDNSRAPLPPIGDLDEPLHLDSLSMIRLVAFFESDLNMRIEDDELLEDNFVSLRALGKLIDSKLAAGEPR